MLCVGTLYAYFYLLLYYLIYSVEYTYLNMLITLRIALNFLCYAVDAILTRNSFQYAPKLHVIADFSDTA